VWIRISSRTFNLLDLLFTVGFVLGWVKILIICRRGLLLGLLCIFSSLNESTKDQRCLGLVTSKTKSTRHNDSIHHVLTFAAAFSAFFLAAASAFNNFFRAFFDKGCPFSSNRTSDIAAVAFSTALSAMVQILCFCGRWTCAGPDVGIREVRPLLVGAFCFLLFFLCLHNGMVPYGSR
jgi:hypothetical protein